MKTKAPPTARDLLALVDQIIADSNGDILKMDVAKKIGVRPPRLSEWLGGKHLFALSVFSRVVLLPRGACKLTRWCSGARGSSPELEHALPEHKKQTRMPSEATASRAEQTRSKAARSTTAADSARIVT